MKHQVALLVRVLKVIPGVHKMGGHQGTMSYETLGSIVTNPFDNI